MKHPPAIEAGVRLLLNGLGVDLEDPNFKDTPARVARMYEEMLTQEAVHWATFPSQSTDLVLLRNHRTIGICPHHLQPIEYRCHVGYIPGEKTVGLSKLARVVNAQLTVPMLHEDLASHTANALVENLKPHGAGVVIAGAHGCMRYRGIESEHADVVVSARRGSLLANSSAWSEFMQIIGRP